MEEEVEEERRTEKELEEVVKSKTYCRSTVEAWLGGSYCQEGAEDETLHDWRCR